jgi:DHA1 family tetracycline resistance protein-like MFS transporter
VPTEKIKAKLSGKALPIVLLTIFLDLLGVGVLLPIIPQLLADPASNYYLLPAGWTYQGGLVLLGWLVAIYPLMQFLSTPILGQLSDRYGRKPVLGFSIFGTAIGYVLFAIGILTRNIPLLFFSRALDGITGGNLSVAQAVIADITPPKDRAKRFALIGAAFGAGFVLGPYLGAKLASPGISFFGIFHTPHWFNPATPFWFTAILSLVNLGILLALLPETHKQLRHVKIKLTKSLSNIFTAVSYPGLRTIFPTVFLFWGGFAFFQTFFQVLLIDKLHFTPNNIGDFFAYVGIWIAVVQAVITPLLAKRYKPHVILRFTVIGAGLALLLYLTATDTRDLLWITPIFAFFLGNSIANSLALVSMTADAHIQGEVLGINASVQSLAQAIPAIMAGYIAAIGINTPVLVGGLTVIAGGILFLAIYRPSKRILEQSYDDVPAAPAH